MTATSSEPAAFLKPGPLFTSVTSPQPMMPQRTAFRPAKCPVPGIGSKVVEPGPRGQPSFSAAAGAPWDANNPERYGVRHSALAQDLVDNALELGRAEGLLQEEVGGRPHEVVPQQIGAVAAREEGLQLRAVAAQDLHEVAAGHPAGHDDVGEDEVDLFAAGRPYLQGGPRRRRLEHIVAAALENRAACQAHQSLVLDDKYRLGARLARLLVGSLRLGRRSPGHAREMNPELGADADARVHLYPPLVLLDDAVNSGEAQARSLPDLLGREERIEDARHDLRGYAGARVRDRDAREAALERLRHPPAIRLVPLDERGLYRQAAAARHRVPGIHHQVQEHLFDHPVVRIYGRKVGLGLHLKGYVLADHPAQEPRRVLDHR